MEEIKLEAHVRNEVGSSAIKQVHRDGLIPGVVYGHSQKTVHIKVDRRTYERIMRQHHGESVVFHLSIKENGKSVADYPAIVKEEQHHPASDKILHIDFKYISLTEKIEVKIPIVAKGEPVGVKKGGGSLEHIIWELEIVCLPTQIPQHLDVDVSQLEIGQNIQLKDIQLPAGVVTEHDPEAIVFSVVPPKEEELPEEAPAAEGAEEPEVIKKGKEKEGEEEAAEPEKKEEKADKGDKPDKAGKAE